MSDAKINIKNNKLNFYYEIESPLSTKPLQINISSGLTVKSGKVALNGLQQTSSNKLINTSKLISILDKTSPLAFTSDIMNNKNSKVYIDSVNIKDNIIHIKGLVLIPKNVITKG